MKEGIKRTNLVFRKDLTRQDFKANCWAKVKQLNLMQRRMDLLQVACAALKTNPTNKRRTKQYLEVTQGFQIQLTVKFKMLLLVIFLEMTASFLVQAQLCRVITLPLSFYMT